MFNTDCALRKAGICYLVNLDWENSCSMKRFQKGIASFGWINIYLPSQKSNCRPFAKPKHKTRLTTCRKEKHQHLKPWKNYTDFTLKTQTIPFSLSWRIYPLVPILAPYGLILVTSFMAYCQMYSFKPMESGFTR